MTKASLAALLGALLILWAAWAIGGEFPLTSTTQSFESTGFHLVEMHDGLCDTGPVTSLRLINTGETVGWHLWWTPTRLIALRFPFGAQERAAPDLVASGVIDAGRISITSEVPFDPLVHTSPCQWLDQATL